ncbi:response regulator [Alphaproteobacteria bacterium]|nr:response regulator [Alphaproteobacteria bacterium]
MLVVEDTLPDQVLVEKKIKSLWPECNVVTVGTLHAAYKTFQTQNFDIVLLDLNLPDGFGPNSVKEMRRFNRNIPIVVMTGMLTPLTTDESLRLGANGIIPKSDIIGDNFINILQQNTAS